MSKCPVFLGLITAACLGSAAPAQLLGGLPQPVGGTIGGVGNSVDNVLGGLTGTPAGDRSSSHAIAPVSLDLLTRPLDQVQATASQLAQLRKLRLDALVRANRSALDRDEDGQPVRRGELIVLDPDSASLGLAVEAGFRMLRDERDPSLGLRIVTLSIPERTNVRAAMKMLRKAAPQLQADYDHLYEPAGGALLPAAATLAAATPTPAGKRIAMIDGGIASHPALARASIEQRGFAGPAQPTGHGTAVGSLLVGDQGSFRGAARGAQLFVGDVYGGNAAAGSASTIVRALAWAAAKRPAVINISLVGPKNLAMERAVRALQARGIPLVAAVGNDGPAAPPQFPASYPGVIAVTAVDSADRALREAGSTLHLDFAAPGADLVAALPGKGFTSVRGTSFAAPFVAARYAATGSMTRLAAEAVPGKGKVGRGIICKTCRILPKSVGLR